MQRLKLDEDIKPLSEFRANATGYINQVQQTKRPLVITSHGKSAVVLMGVVEYEDLIEKIEMLQDVRVAEQQLGSGKGISHADAPKRIIRRPTH